MPSHTKGLEKIVRRDVANAPPEKDNSPSLFKPYFRIEWPAATKRTVKRMDFVDFTS